MKIQNEKNFMKNFHKWLCLKIFYGKTTTEPEISWFITTSSLFSLDFPYVFPTQIAIWGLPM